MKKNISINISGIVFHIEEDAYKDLQQYLDSINDYFSTYEENKEIISDIESRIAELLLEGLTNGRQVVSAEDVAQLVGTMGNTSDFEAMEEETDFARGEQAESTKNTSSSRNPESRKLFRDLNNKILGGVCSGLAHYIKIDPLWVRIFFLLLLSTGTSLIAYFILCIVVPGSEELTENGSVKKFYRDPDGRVLGGVCAGLAKYLNIDVIIIRVLFISLFMVGSFFGFIPIGFGLSFIPYLILWAITRKASSITDKMQMKGEKVTLSNIDENIKKKQNEKGFGSKREGGFTKVILFPFRLIGKILSGISKALAPLMLFMVSIIRVFTGAIIALFGLANMFMLVVATGVALGLYNGKEWHYPGYYIPFEFLNETISLTGLIAFIIVIFIPFLYLFIAGITVIAKRKIVSSTFNWSTLGIWFIALLLAAATIPAAIIGFRKQSSIIRTENIAVNGQTLVLDMDNQYDDYRRNGFFIIDLDLRAADDDQVKLKSLVWAFGHDRRDAEENADQVDYRYTVRDSVIVFGGMFRLEPHSAYRAQRLEMTLYIPKGQPFKVKRGMQELLGRFGRPYRWSTVYGWSAIYGNTWVFTKRGLECLTCDSKK